MIVDIYIVQAESLSSRDEDSKFQLALVRRASDIITRVYWILRREVILAEGGTVCFQGQSPQVTKQCHSTP